MCVYVTAKSTGDVRLLEPVWTKQRFLGAHKVYTYLFTHTKQKNVREEHCKYMRGYGFFCANKIQHASDKSALC